MKNSDDDDDIDLLIISSKGSLWFTRFLVTFMIELTGRRRRPKERKVKNKICLNMYLSEETLALPKKEWDLYSAHEVVQMKPLWDRDTTYQKFLKANRWAREYLPNAIEKDTKILGYKGIKRIKSREIFNFQFSIFNFLERLARDFQFWYMRRRKTNEVVTETYIRFHPKSARNWVLSAYQKRLKKLGLDSS